MTNLFFILPIDFLINLVYNIIVSNKGSLFTETTNKKGLVYHNQPFFLLKKFIGYDIIMVS